MPVPDFQSLMLPVLRALSDGAETPVSEVRTRVASAEGLTPEDVRELLPNSSQPVFTNRVPLGDDVHGTRRSGGKGSARHLSANRGRRRAAGSSADADRQECPM